MGEVMLSDRITSAIVEAAIWLVIMKNRVRDVVVAARSALREHSPAAKGKSDE